MCMQHMYPHVDTCHTLHTHSHTYAHVPTGLGLGVGKSQEEKSNWGDLIYSWAYHISVRGVHASPGTQMCAPGLPMESLQQSHLLQPLYIGTHAHMP